jgi:hypothetical protein
MTGQSLKNNACLVIKFEFRTSLKTDNKTEKEIICKKVERLEPELYFFLIFSCFLIHISI